jgi:manganese/iron transport system permease protein
VSGLSLYLYDPLGRELLLQAVLISALIAAAAGALSCFLVLKGWALMGDAISHAILPGVVLAYLIGIPLAVGAFFAGMFCAVATGYLAENSRVKQDTVMGVVFSGMFGLGVVLYTKIETEVHLDHILFGDMLGVTWANVLQTGVISILALALIIAKRRDLLVFTFDPQHGRAVGLYIDWLHYGLLTILSLVIVSALQAVGLILSIALVIAPGAIAHLLTDRFDRMLLVSIATGVLSSIIGVLLSFQIDAAPAPTIVVVMMIVFIFAFLFAPKHGIFRKRERVS